jgi:hypothetical protein
MSTSNNMLMPKGTTAERPVSPVDGMMRYNTTLEEVEIFQSSTWRSLRFKESTKIIQQTLGPIDGYTYFYGPLNAAYSPTNVASTTDNFGGQNLLVFIDNVFQIHGTNYAIEDNPTASVALASDALLGATTLTFASTESIPNNSVVSGSSFITAGTRATVVNDTDVLIDSPATGLITSGTAITFTADPGYYIDLTTDPDYIGMVGKNITILHGFDR